MATFVNMWRRSAVIMLLLASMVLSACAGTKEMSVDLVDDPLTHQSQTADGKPVYAKLRMASIDTCIHAGSIYRAQAKVNGKIVDQGDKVITGSPCAAQRTAGLSGVGAASIGVTGKLLDDPSGDFTVNSSGVGVGNSSAASESEANLNEQGKE